MLLSATPHTDQGGGVSSYVERAHQPCATYVTRYPPSQNTDITIAPPDRIKLRRKLEKRASLTVAVYFLMETTILRFYAVWWKL